MPRGDKAKRGEGKHLELHGCTIVLTARTALLPGVFNNFPFVAARCAGYSECRFGMYSDLVDESSCLDDIATLFPQAEGWTAAGEPKPITGDELSSISRAMKEGV